MIKPARGLAAPETNALIGTAPCCSAPPRASAVRGGPGRRALRRSQLGRHHGGRGLRRQRLASYTTGGQVVILGPTRHSTSGPA
ncbi:hypothetical protein ACRAWD_07860 [Caulobacter segnis]